MKKCPSCEKTYEDSLRFCQTDGTPLIDDEPAFDPYATIVAPKSVLMPEEPAAAADVVEPEIQAAEESPIAEPDDLLDLPTPDPLKTMFASDAEMKEVLEVNSAAATDESVPEFASQPYELDPMPSFDPPPSPFAEQPMESFDPVAQSPVFEDEPATVLQSAPNPFDVPAAPPVDMMPAQSAPIEPAFGGSFSGGESYPSTAPMAVIGGQSKGLAIGSLVAGILSLLCCNWFIVGIAAVIMGFIAKGKADKDPENYGGRGMAVAGLAIGAISMVLGVVVWALYFLGFMANIIGNSGF